MGDEQVSAPPAPPPLGPGDDDPLSPADPAGAGGPAAPPLGPGDDDPRSPAKDAAPARGPLAPGESAVENPDDDFHFIAPPPASPGGVATVRHIVRIPKNRAPEIAAAAGDGATKQEKAKRKK